jgi:hypothetical protein
VWPRGSRAASSEAETRPRGRQALERGGGSVARRLVLERGVPRPAVRWASAVSWAMGPSFLRASTTRSVFCGLWVCSFASYYFSKGVFPVIRGPLWLSLTVLLHLTFNHVHNTLDHVP